MKEELTIAAAWVMLLYILLSPVIAACDSNNICQRGVDSNRTLYLDNSSLGYVSGAVCILDVYDANWTVVVDDGNMTELGNGFYYYTLNGTTFDEDGIFTIQYNCDKDGIDIYTSGEFEIASDTPSNMFSYWNNTIFNDIVSKVNATWYNVITPASSFILNVFDYLDDNLTVSLNQTVINQISETTAVQTWNTTVTGPKSVEITPECRNRPFWNSTSRRWETQC